MLGDRTRVRINDWADLRERAMTPVYKQDAWYHLLNDSDRTLLEMLRAAQESQGDMHPLQPGHMHTTLTVPLLELEAHNRVCGECPTNGEQLERCAL